MEVNGLLVIFFTEELFSFEVVVMVLVRILLFSFCSIISVFFCSIGLAIEVIDSIFFRAKSSSISILKPILVI